MAGIYIHIPFCKSRCAYCDFFSTTHTEVTDAYVAALEHEMTARQDELGGATVSSIYVGGGTPSVLTARQLRQILDSVCAHFTVDDDAEVTVEMNPDDIQHLLFNDLQFYDLLFNHFSDRTQVNRVSLGIQTFDDSLLRLLRRRHDAQTAVEAVRLLPEAGIKNISIDLIYGLPGQTLEMWERDLETALSLGVQHLSAYALSYEEGTALTRWLAEGRVQEVPDEVQVEMYERLCERTRRAGFEHYEISNFALPGFHSRHNSSYWTGAPYLGFGPGAHSYDGQRCRRANKPDLAAYLQKWGSGERGLESPQEWFTVEVLTERELYDEAVMCGLRTAQGVELQRIRECFGQQQLDELLTAAAPHLRDGRLALTDGRLHLTAQALMVSDDVMSDLMAS